MRNVEKALSRLQSEVNRLRLDVKKASDINASSSSPACYEIENTSIDESIPMEDLLVLDGTLNGIRVKVLKDDGCNTNVVSHEFFEKNFDRFDSGKCDVEVAHSKKESTEHSSEMIIGATLKMGNHKYKSNWIVASCRYDVLLGMPWHVIHNPSIDYKERTIQLDESTLRPDPKPPDFGTKVSNIGVKSFRRLLQDDRLQPGVQIFQVVQGSLTNGNSNDKTKLMNSCHPRLRRILEKYQDVLQDKLPPGLPPERSVDHAIEVEDGAKPPHRPLYQLSPAELKAAKDYVIELLNNGKIRPSKSPYGAPLFFVKEKNNKLRGVVDYRALNRITKRNNAPLPRSDEMFDLLGEAKYFSKLDLKTGFHQIQVRPEDVEKTAFNTKYGQFEYLVMPMGLCNAPATFQSLMNRIFYDCIDKFLVVYMDDLLIFSKDEESHLHHIETVFSRLHDHKLYVSPKKCDLWKSEIEFLGLIVGRNGIQADPRKVEILRNWPKPKSLTDVRSFMGLLQFFRRFIKNFSGIAAPLTNLTKKDQGIQKWDSRCDEAFQKLKNAITSAPILVAPDWKKSFRGHIDASNFAVGGTLTQLDENGKDRIIAFFSRKLSSAEQNYTANDRELLGLIFFLKRFRCYLEGASFEIFTDNQVLKHFFTKAKLSRREAGWLETLGNFGIFPISLKPGKIHVLGDTLSRAPHASFNSFEVPYIDVDQVIGSYDDDRFFGPLIRAKQGENIEDGLLRKRLIRLLPLYYLDGKRLLYNGKVCVPRKAVSSVLQLAHDSKVAGHFGFSKTLSRLKNFHWKHKHNDVLNYVKGCITCQQKKDHQGKRLTDPSSLEVPQRRWGSLSTDFIVGLPRTKNGYDSITTWVDRLTRRVHFIPSKETDTAVDVANAFFSNLFKHHGLPDSIVSDRDPKFTSSFWRKLMGLCGVKLKMSTSHHPQTDGASEVMNRMIENYLRCFCSYSQDDWDELLASAEFAYNSAVSDDLGLSPFEVDLGWNPKSPLDLISRTDTPNETLNEFKSRLKETLEDAQYSYQLSKASQSAQSSMKYKPHSYFVGDKLWINMTLFKDAYSRSQKSDKLTAKRYGPFVVTKLIGKNAVKLDLPSHFKIHDVVHVVHTVPYTEQPIEIDAPVQPRPDPVPTIDGDEYYVDKILSHRKRGKGHQFLTLMKGAPTHDAEWQPSRDFIDKDGTINETFLEYIKSQELLPHLYTNQDN